MSSLQRGTPEDKSQTTIRVLQLNLNHCEAAHDLLRQTVRELNLDLALISEPYIHLATHPWETDSTGKAVIWSCGKLPFQSVANHREAGFVAARVDDIYFYRCYAPPSLPLDKFTDFLNRLTEDAKQHPLVAIAGDFNSWAVDWGSKETNARGKVLLEAMATLDAVLLNNGDKPTLIRGEASSIIDLTFVSGSLAKGNCSWEVLNIYTASDHCAILWTVSSDPNVSKRYQRTNAIGWRVSSYDETTFVGSLDKDPINGENAEKKAKDLMRGL